MSVIPGTTLILQGIVRIVLFAIGTGSVKAFAIILIIGIITSMFTTVIVSRAMIHLIYSSKLNFKKLSTRISS